MKSQTRGRDRLRVTPASLGSIRKCQKKGRQRRVENVSDIAQVSTLVWAKKPEVSPERSLTHKDRRQFKKLVCLVLA